MNNKIWRVISMNKRGGVIEMDRSETLEKILKELNEKTAKIQNNKGNKETEERIKELYKLLKKAMNNKIFTLIKLIDETM